MARVNRIGFTRLGDDGEQRGPAQCNIIFVHGLRGHPQRTWGQDADNDRTSISSRKSLFRAFNRKRVEPGNGQEQRYPYWPHEFLSTDLPTARIWTYGYNADVIEGFFGAASGNSVSQHGRDLAIKLAREVEEGPIIFLAHSLGGIVVKDAINRAETWRHRTRAIVFLGTPHRGSLSAGWAEIASNLAAIALHDSNKKITAALRVDGEVLGNIHEQFIKVATRHDIKLHSFQEARGISGIKGVSGKIVSDFSSALGLPDEQVETLDADHRQMVKCTGKEDGRYRTILDVLRQLLRAGHALAGSDIGDIQITAPTIPAADAPARHPVGKSYDCVHVTLIYWEIDGIESLVKKLSDVLGKLYLYEVTEFRLTPDNVSIDTDFPWKNLELINDGDLQILYYIGASHRDPEAAARGFMDILAVSHSYPHQKSSQHNWLSSALGIPNLFSDVMVILDCYWAGLSDESTSNVSFLHGGHDWARYGLLFAGYEDENSPVGRFSYYMIDALQNLTHLNGSCQTFINCEEVIQEVRRITEESESAPRPEWLGVSEPASFILSPDSNGNRRHP